ncbi:MAG: hypothetical protein ACK4NN_15645 [Rheinheimera sp.]
MSKLADFLIAAFIVMVLIILVFRFSPLSVYVVEQNFGLALTGGASLVLVTGLAIKAEYEDTKNLRNRLVYLGSFWFSFLFLDLIFYMRNMFNQHEPIHLVIGSLLISSSALFFLYRDLKGKEWFSL